MNKTSLATPEHPRRPARQLHCTYGSIHCGSLAHLYPVGARCDIHAPKPRPGYLGLAYYGEKDAAA